MTRGGAPSFVMILCLLLIGVVAAEASAVATSRSSKQVHGHGAGEAAGSEVAAAVAMIREGSFQDHIAQISAQTALASQAFTGQAFRAADEVVVPQRWLTDRTRSAVYLPIKVPSSRLRMEDVSLSVNDRTLKIMVKPTSWTGVEMGGAALDAAGRRYELMLSALEAQAREDSSSSSLLQRMQEWRETEPTPEVQSLIDDWIREHDVHSGEALPLPRSIPVSAEIFRALRAVEKEQSGTSLAQTASEGSSSTHKAPWNEMLKGIRNLDSEAETIKDSM